MNIRMIKNMLLFSLLLAGFNVTARTHEETQKAAFMCAVLHLSAIPLPYFVNALPLPKCAPSENMSFGPLFINLFTSAIAFGVNVACGDNKPEISLGTSIAAHMINLSMVGYNVWQRHQEHCQRNQPIISMDDIIRLQEARLRGIISAEQQEKLIQEMYQLKKEKR